jgi:hypothetical protein
LKRIICNGKRRIWICAEIRPQTLLWGIFANSMGVDERHPRMQRSQMHDKRCCHGTRPKLTLKQIHTSFASRVKFIQRKESAELSCLHAHKSCEIYVLSAPYRFINSK